MSPVRTIKYLIGIFLLTSSVFVVSSCTPAPRVWSRGNSIEPSRLEMIEPGTTNREKVTELIGSPSSKALFGDEIWYYVSERQEVLAFFAPEIKNRTVTAVQFDKSGTVLSINQFGLEKSTKIIPVNRKTPTVGKEMTVLDQIIGNFNRLRTKNSAKDK